MLTEGDKAPEFNLPALNNQTISLKDLRGKKIILYFYPKDSTPGCTTEACDFRDNMGRLKTAGVEVLGVSRDNLKSHQKFVDKFDLPFPLLSDEKGEVCQQYDCWKEKSMFGKKYFGIERTTYLIDEKGVIQKIWRKVKAKGHVEEVMESL